MTPIDRKAEQEHLKANGIAKQKIKDGLILRLGELGYTFKDDNEFFDFSEKRINIIQTTPKSYLWHFYLDKEILLLVWDTYAWYDVKQSEDSVTLI